MKKAQADVEAAKYSLEDLRNDIRLNVALAYFQVIFSKDQISLVEERIELLNTQLKQTEKLLEAGVLTKGDVYTLKAQLATEKVNLVNNNNFYRQNLLNLILSMNADPNKDYELERPDIDDLMMQQGLTSVNSIFDQAIDYNPGLKSLKFQIAASEYQIRVNRASLFPTLSLSYGLRSFYSSSARPLLGFDQDPEQGLVPIYGDPNSISRQLGDNIGQAVGLSLNIPIFQNYLVRQNVRTSEINLENTILNYENEQNQLYQSILLAHQDAEAAYATFEATQEQILAADISFKFAQTRYDAGVIDFPTYLETLNNKTRAERELLQAKYDFILKTKILDLYQGKTLEF